MKILYLLIISVCLASCHKDEIDSSQNTEIKTQITVPFDFPEIEGNLVGYVFGEDSQPIGNANVSIYSGTTTTNEFGVFEFEDIKLDGQGTLIKVTKEGYLDGANVVYPNDNGAGTARLKLQKANILGSFISEQGGQIPFDNDGVLTFEPNSIALQNGSTYAGTVDVNVIYTPTSDISLDDEIQGGFIGQAIDESNRVLGSFGALHASLLGSNNEELKIKSDRLFTIRFPIPTSQLASAEDVIKVWKFDSSTGYWVEYGVADKIGEFYVAEVKAVGDFMFADPYSISHFCGRLINNAELPVKNYKFNAYVDGKLCGSGISDNDGFICSKLPKAISLSLEIIHPFCNEVAETIAIGPNEDVENIGDILIDLDQDLRTGKVTCNDVAVSNALIIISNENNTIIQTTNGNGDFNLNLNDIVCNSDSEFKLFALRGSDSSPKLSMTVSNMQDLMLEICKSDCGFSISVVAEKNDYCNSGEYDALRVMVEGGSGQFSYKWDNGILDIANNSIQSGSESCVTVTDLASGCEVNACFQVVEYEKVGIGVLEPFQSSCEQNAGQVNMSVSGGAQPYEYKWEGPDGFTSNEQNPMNLWPGQYSVTVSDANECEEINQVEIYDATVPFTSEIEDACDFSIIRIFEGAGYGPYIYSWIGGQSTTNELIITEIGEYSVEVVDQNGCNRTRSYTISNIGTDVPLNTSYECDVNMVNFDPTIGDNEYFYESVSTSERFDLPLVAGDVRIPILESGYRFFYGVQNLVSTCERMELIELPHFEGLSVSNENTSCDTCNDGFINVFLNNNLACTGGCETGETIIIDKLTGDNVTSANVQSELGAGVYLVIVTDANNGCYIAHEEVIVE